MSGGPASGGGHRRVSHRAEVRPRYGRITVLTASLATTAVALLGGLGVLPSATGDAPSEQDRTAVTTAADTGADSSGPSEDSQSEPSAAEDAAPDNSSVELDPGFVLPGPTEVEAELPSRSGSGRRVVFSQSLQHVWLVGGDDEVRRDYPVSGSAEDNLDPGTYEVYSRSMDAIGIDDSGTMRYFVRFTQGTSGAAIGFHDIPINDGAKVQTIADLGTPLSHGCIRQKRADAKVLWRFAPIGTEVVVVA